jgi:purine-nucleoside phosphorylase
VITRADPSAKPREAVDALRSRVQGLRPDVAIVLGSGLGALTERLERPIRIPFREIPGFPEPTVPGHDGELVAGSLAGRKVIVQSGRFHPYEGHSAASSALAVRAMAGLGAGTLILTNAAGGIRRTFRPGDLMLISDHVNLTFLNPLIGPRLPGEARFPDMHAAYDHELRACTRTVARERRIELQEGVYAGLVGPSYETQSEVRMLERLGADAVGMSTVLEAIAARALGLRCLAISTITNMACGVGVAKLSHDEVREVAAGACERLGTLLEGVVEGLAVPAERGDEAQGFAGT